MKKPTDLRLQHTAPGQFEVKDAEPRRAVSAFPRHRAPVNETKLPSSKGKTHYKPSGLGDAPVLCGSKARTRFVSGYWVHVDCIKCLKADVIDEAKMDDAQISKSRRGVR